MSSGQGAITEHSICQPGLPGPQGDSHEGSPSLDFFQSAKSVTQHFSCARMSDRAPSASCSNSVSLRAEGSSLQY